MKKKKMPQYMLTRKRQGALFLIPSFVFLVALLVVPLIYVIVLSLHQWNGSPVEPMRFVGLQNYVKVGSINGVSEMIRFTLLFGVVVTLCVVTLSVLMAFALDKPQRGRHVNRSFLRICWYIPALIGGVAIGLIWRVMYNYNNGVINAILETLGFARVNWLENYSVTSIAVIVAQVWAMLGGNIIIFLAGLQTVPVELYEAAEIDGANTWQQRLKITLPMIMPTITISLVTTSIAAFKSYELPYSISRGMPGYSTRLISQMIMEYSIADLNYGTGATLSVVLTVFIVLLQLVQLFLLRKKEESYE